MGLHFIPYGRQCIDEDDIAAVAAVLRGDFLTTGPKVGEFEESLCAATGARHAVACSNGTTALHLAALALGMKEGEAAIIPSMTFLATANAARYCGAEVVFSDVDPVTGLMGPEHLEEALSRCGGLKPRAVFPVHLKGLGVDLRGLREVADRHGLSVVADSCHAIGGSVNGKPVGAGFYEDLSTFSFHPVKTIATGEGGAVTTNDPEKAALMKRLRHHGMIFTPDKGPWMYEMPDLGFNHRMTDIQCALGVSQLKKLPAFVARRRALADLYDGFLEPLASLVNIPARNGYSDPAWHLYAVQIDFEKAGMGRAALMSALKDKGIGTQVHYIPVHQQPYYKKRYGDIALPGAEAYYARTLSLPLYPSMSDENAAYVVEELKTILRI